MIELLKTFIVAWAFIILGGIAAIYQLCKKGFFKVTVDVDDSKSEKPEIKVDLPDKKDLINMSSTTRKLSDYEKSLLLKQMWEWYGHNPGYPGANVYMKEKGDDNG